MKFLPNLSGPGRSLSGFVQRRSTMIFIMRVSVFYVALLSGSIQLLLANPGRGQKLEETYVTVELNHESLQTLFARIEKQTDLLFTFPEALKSYTGFDLPKGKRSVKETLDIVLEGTPITFLQINSNLIAVFVGGSEGGDGGDVMENVIIGSGGGYKADVVTVTGTVRDASTQESMAGVNVIVKATTRGTTTDVEGKFVIDANDDDVLVFSFIGFKTIEIPVSGRSVIEVMMEGDITALQEVTINAGYYQVKEKEQTGNIGRVSSEEISKQPVANPLQALQGRISGVYIQETTGIPGGGINIQIRGQNSLRNSNTDNGNLPFYIIDGVPFTPTGLSSNLLTLSNSNPLIGINPADIESIEVLKDADATAIYGSRGANGVVLITTKKGRAGKTKANFDFSSGFGKVASKMDLLNTQQYLEMRKEGYKNNGITTIPDNFRTYDIKRWDTTRYTDWQKILIGGTAKQTNAQLSVSGGNANTSFLIGGGFFRQTTVFPGDVAFQRGSGRLSLNHTSDNNKFRANMSATYVTAVNNLSVDFTFASLSLAPNAPALYDDNGNLNWEKNTWSNPLANLEKKYKNHTDNLVTDASFSYEVIPGLRLKTSMGYTNMQVKEVSTVPISSYNPAFASFYKGTSHFGDSYIKTWIVEPQADYSREIGRGKLNILIGTSFQESTEQAQTIEGTGYDSDALLENILAATSTRLLGIKHSRYKYSAIFSRVNYNLMDKYILNVTARRDGSSRFGPGKQFGNFGAIGMAWIFTNENFLKNRMAFLSFGKLRASYGTTGSDAIGNYQYLNTYSPTEYGYNGSSGLALTRLSNLDYSWETNKKMEAGIEFGLANNRIFISTSFYRNRSSDQLVGLPLPVITGQSIVQSNFPATVENRGWEFVVNTTNIKNSNFQWSSSLNFTIPRNELIEFSNIESYPAYQQRYEVGKSIFTRRTLRHTGVDPETGIYQFEDVNKDGNISLSDDGMFLKEISQRYYGGFNNSISYKGLQLDIFFQFVKQTGLSYVNSFSWPGSASNQPADVVQRWRQPGDMTNIQSYSAIFSDAAVAYSNYIDSDNSIVDASFIRLKNVFLSWQLPVAITRKANIDRCKIYVQGQNLLTITDYIGMDPENQRPQSLPPLRMVTFGIQLAL